MFKNNKGFTLVELLVVIAIIGILATVAVTSVSGARQQARDAKRLADVRQISNSLELYYTTSDSYAGACKPGSESGVLTSACKDNDYIKWGLFSDPSGTDACPLTPAGVCDYKITIGPTTYQIDFYLEKGTSALGEGDHFLVPEGFDYTP